MNGVQLTFFNFAGYLVPGIVAVLVFSPLIYLVSAPHPFLEMLTAMALGHDGALRGSFVAGLLLPALALSFLIGVIVSDTASLVRSTIKNKGWLSYSREKDSHFAALLRHGRDEALLQDDDVRQALALQATSKWDLYGSAARARMCNACGLVLAIAALFYAFFSPYLFVVLFSLGLYMIVLGMKRHADYWSFVDTIAFLQVTSDSKSDERRGNR